jgi:hypothetical protein
MKMENEVRARGGTIAAIAAAGSSVNPRRAPDSEEGWHRPIKPERWRETT